MANDGIVNQRAILAYAHRSYDDDPASSTAGA